MDQHLLNDLLVRAYDVTDNWQRDPAQRWVMDLGWYRQVRAAAVTEEQEEARAHAHANAYFGPTIAPSGGCPVCASGPFGSMRELSDHMALMSIPAYREPDPADQLFGLPIDVRDDGGEPRLESPRAGALV